MEVNFVLKIYVVVVLVIVILIVDGFNGVVVNGFCFNILFFLLVCMLVIEGENF